MGSKEEQRAPTAVGRLVADVMRPAATTVEREGHLAGAAFLMQQADQRALIVVDEADHPVAIITDRDLLRAVANGADTAQERITQWTTTDPQLVHPNTVVTEAAQIMVNTANWHLPVVADGRVVGIVGISDIADTLLHSARLASAVVLVRDLARSVDFYQPLLGYTVTVTEADARLLSGPAGSQLYLRQADSSPPRGDQEIGVQWLAWTAGSDDDLQRCEQLLTQRGAYVRRDTVDGITMLQGRDPDGFPVIISYPGPEQAPRSLLHPAIDAVQQAST